MRITIYCPEVYTYGSMIVGRILKDKGHKVYLIRKMDKTLLLKSDVVIFSLYSTLHILDKKIRETIENLKKSKKNKIKIYIAGCVSAYPEIILNELNVDGVIVGEGEITTPKIIEGDEEGLAYKNGDEIVVNYPKERPDLNHPIPLIPKDIGQQWIRGANVYIETHRGCLGNCTFCQVPKFFGKKIRSREVEDVVEEVKAFKKAGAKRIAISGGTGSLYAFKKSVNKNKFFELLEKISEIVGRNNLSVPDMRVDYVDEDILEAIKNYTIGWVFYGIESGSDKVLRDMKKGINREKVLDAIKLAKDCNVKVGGSFIVGYPTETEKDYLLTKDLIVDAELDDVFVSIAEPIPTTELCDLVLSIPKEENLLYKPHEGIYKKLGLSEAEARCFDLLIHSEMWKSNPKPLTPQLYNIYLNEAKMQGKDIRDITELLFKYRDILLQK
ncbi:methyl-coenzyme M reductase glutamine C-methyltransferase [Methanocaldococcus sp.]|uniref:methyl-coenzyme M reductase glutamine C-methyltransferase n=1 Tax=Methanocaldococcus sp. TaxID=2152917 RepID=UPI002631B00E|nr:methyl-coenzyme M reductase glutamine C-methyltransferase [Methanocaldococcus sp.]MCQ6254779.1 TIGR04014 family B12-binding domain/radical SAM domain-containing protein [Methanocaldococcus sp.]